MEQVVIGLSSLGGIGVLSLACLLASRRSRKHPAFLWWFWRWGLVPVLCSAFAVYIDLTPRDPVEGSTVNYGRLDFVAIMFWGLLVPLAYFIMAGLILLGAAIFGRQAK